MYLNFYNLKEKPFSLTPDPAFFYNSGSHKRAVAFLKYGLQESKGFIQLTGPVGSGKTTLLRSILSQLDEKIKTAYIINPSAPFPDLLRSILKDLEVSNIPPTRSKLELLDFFHDYLLRQMKRSQPVIIIFDEAQNLSLKNLEEIRMLSNFETTKEKLLQIVFVGQPELIKKLDLAELRQLKQRIQVRYHLSPLTLDEVREYIAHRLAVAGSNGDIAFTDDACSAIYDFSRGIPRLINSVCDIVLLIGYLNDRKTFDRDVIEEAMNEMGCSFGDEAGETVSNYDSEPGGGNDAHGSQYPLRSEHDEQVLEQHYPLLKNSPHGSPGDGSRKGEKSPDRSPDEGARPKKDQIGPGETTLHDSRTVRPRARSGECKSDNTDNIPLASPESDSLVVSSESPSSFHQASAECREKDRFSNHVPSSRRDENKNQSALPDPKGSSSANLGGKGGTFPAKSANENRSSRYMPYAKKSSLLKWLPISRRISRSKETFVNSKITILFQDGSVAEGFSRNLDPQKAGFHFSASKGQKAKRKKFILFDNISAIHIGEGCEKEWEKKAGRLSDLPPKGRQIVVALKNGRVFEGITTRRFDPDCRRFFVISFIGNGKVSWELIERSGTIGILTESFREGIYAEEFENLEHFTEFLPLDLIVGCQYELNGDLYLSLHDYAAASDAYQKALEENPGSEWLSLKVSIAHFNEGIKNLHRNDYPTAIKEFEKAAGNEHLSQKAKAKIQMVEQLLFS